MGVKRCSDLSSAAPLKVEDSICTRWVNGSTVRPPAKLSPLTNGVEVPSAGLNDTTSPMKAREASRRPSLLKTRSDDPKPELGPANGVGGTAAPAAVNWLIWLSKLGKLSATNRLPLAGLNARPPVKSKPGSNVLGVEPTIFNTVPLPPPTAFDTKTLPLPSTVTDAANGTLPRGSSSRSGAPKPEAVDAEWMGNTVSPVCAANMLLMPKSPLSALSVT